MTAREPAARKVAYALLFSAFMHCAVGGLVGRGVIGGAGIAAEAAAQSHALHARLALASNPIPSASTEKKSEAAPDAVPAPRHRAAPTRSVDDGALLAVPAPYYYPAAELDRRPHPLTPVTLDEPSRDMSEGYLILRLLISEAGVVDDVIVVLNDAQPLLVRNARQAFSRARYAPGLKNGRAVKSQMMIEVKLDREPA